MKLFLLSFAAFWALYPSCATAQDPLDSKALIVRDTDGNIHGLGPKGRISQEQGYVLALERIPGQVLETSIHHENSRYYYEYKILTRDKSIYEVELNSNTGEVYEIEIEYLSENAVLPMRILPQETAEALALNHVDENTLGRRTPKLLNAEIGVRNRKPVYIFQHKKSGKTYDLIMDAEDGDILEFEKQ